VWPHWLVEAGQPESVDLDCWELEDVLLLFEEYAFEAADFG